MKLRAYLVDDEPLALERLRRLLELTGRVEGNREYDRARKSGCGIDCGSSRCVLFGYSDATPKWFRGSGAIAQPSRSWFSRLPTIITHSGVWRELSRLSAEAGRTRVSGSGAQESGAVARIGANSLQPDLQALLKQLADSLRETKPEYPTGLLRGWETGFGSSTWHRSRISMPKTN